MMSDHPGRQTARDLLEREGGEEHALHTVLAYCKPKEAQNFMRCSCGATFKIKNSKTNKEALRNVTLNE